MSDSGESHLNFDLLIEKDGPQYRARVTGSPCGEAITTFAPPLQPLEAAHLRLLVVRSRSAVRSIDSSAATMVRDIGERLFRGAFSGDVEKCFSGSIHIADQRGLPLRIRLRLDDPEVAQLPWEYLRDPSPGGKFLALDLDTPMVRYLQIARPATRIRVEGALKVLAMISTPTDRPGIDAAKEWVNLQRALDPLLKQGLVSIHRLAQPTFAELERELARADYHIFHFVGHGGFDQQTQEGVLVFTQADGSESWVSSDQLGAILGDERTLQLAVLNACEGAVSEGKDIFAGCAQRLVSRGVPAVVAMQAEITDEAAIDFSERFYEALAAGRPVDEALIRGRKAIYAAPNQLEWGTPVLYMRSGDGRLFDVAPQPRIDAAHEPVAPLGATPFAPSTVASLPVAAPGKPPVTFRRRLLVFGGIMVALIILFRILPTNGTLPPPQPVASEVVPVVVAVEPEALAIKLLDSFYGLLRAGAFDEAWNLLGSEWQTKQKAEDFRAGYARTVDTRFTPRRPPLREGDAVRVTGEIVATEIVAIDRGGGRLLDEVRYSASYLVRSERGRWVIASGEATERSRIRK